MKTFALAVVTAAGLMLTAGSAEAQFRYRNSGYTTTYSNGSIYSYPSYSYPSTYYASPYSSGVVTSGYTPYYGSNVVVPASGYSNYYTPTYSYPSYSTYPSYSGYGTYSSGTYSSGTYITPTGGAFRGRGWRW